MIIINHNNHANEIRSPSKRIPQLAINSHDPDQSDCRNSVNQIVRIWPTTNEQSQTAKSSNLGQLNCMDLNNPNRIQESDLLISRACQSNCTNLFIHFKNPLKKIPKNFTYQNTPVWRNRLQRSGQSNWKIGYNMWNTALENKILIFSYLFIKIYIAYIVDKNLLGAANLMFNLLPPHYACKIVIFFDNSASFEIPVN